MDTLCKIRDLQRAVAHFEGMFEERYGICLNEGMVLCTLSKAGKMCPGELGEAMGLTPSNEAMGLTPSNMSKVLRAAETKGLVARELCCRDRRQTFYSLTEKGRKLLRSLDCRAVEIPEQLRDWLREE